MAGLFDLFNKDDPSNPQANPYGSNKSGLFGVFSDDAALRMQLAGQVLSSLAYGQVPNTSGVLMQAQMLADTRNQKKRLYNAAVRYADKIRPTNPELADAVLADPSLISEIMGEKAKQQLDPKFQFYQSLNPDTPGSPAAGGADPVREKIVKLSGIPDLTDAEVQRLKMASVGGPEQFSQVLNQINDDRRIQATTNQAMQQKQQEMKFAEEVAQQLEKMGMHAQAQQARMDPQYARSIAQEVFQQQQNPDNQMYQSVFGAPSSGGSAATGTGAPASGAPPGATGSGGMDGGMAVPPSVPPPSVPGPAGGTGMPQTGMPPAPMAQPAPTPVQTPSTVGQNEPLDLLAKAQRELGIPDLTEEELARIQRAGPKRMSTVVSQIVDDRRADKANSRADEQQKLTASSRLYDDYYQKTKGYQDVIDNADRAASIAGSGDAVSQMETLYSYIKAMDDTAVREGEVALARSTSSYLEQVGILMKRVNEGTLAAEDVIAQMQKRIRDFGDLAKSKRDAERKRIEARAKAMNVPVEYVFGAEDPSTFDVKVEPKGKDLPKLQLPNLNGDQ